MKFHNSERWINKRLLLARRGGISRLGFSKAHRNESRTVVGSSVPRDSAYRPSTCRAQVSIQPLREPDDPVLPVTSEGGGQRCELGYPSA